ncbi:MAG: hypothetical protein K2X00_21900 [Nitrospiraceae bacterium]|nr:hypothetical protein [Nitrospiraceae bacterium]
MLAAKALRNVATTGSRNISKALINEYRAELDRLRATAVCMIERSCQAGAPA